MQFIEDNVRLWILDEMCFHIACHLKDTQLSKQCYYPLFQCVYKSKHFDFDTTMDYNFIKNSIFKRTTGTILIWNVPTWLEYKRLIKTPAYFMAQGMLLLNNSQYAISFNCNIIKRYIKVWDQKNGIGKTISERMW